MAHSCWMTYSLSKQLLGISPGAVSVLHGKTINGDKDVILVFKESVESTAAWAKQMCEQSLGICVNAKGRFGGNKDKGIMPLGCSG